MACSILGEEVCMGLEFPAARHHEAGTAADTSGDHHHGGEEALGE